MKQYYQIQLIKMELFFVHQSHSNGTFYNSFENTYPVLW